VQVAPMLAKGGVDADVVYTQRAHHAWELMQKLPLGKYEAVVSVSGDGLLHEILNGLLDRPDWPEAVKTPMAIVRTVPGLAF